MRQQMVSWGFSSQTWIGAERSSWTVCGDIWMHPIRNIPEVAIGFMSSGREGLSVASTPLSATGGNQGPAQSTRSDPDSSQGTVG